MSPGGLERAAEHSGDRGFPRAVERKSQNVRQQLRLATTDIHEALHRHPGFVSLLEQRMTLPQYRALLARLHGFHRSLDLGLSAVPVEVRSWLYLARRERAPALRADLRFLGVSEREIDALPLCDRLPPVHSNAELMGRLYVVEGSALGGKLMASRLDPLLGSESREGRQFFLGSATPDPLPWPMFCRLLETQDTRADVDAMIQSARTTFIAMALWLNESRMDA